MRWFLNNRTNGVKRSSKVRTKSAGRRAFLQVEGLEERAVPTVSPVAANAGYPYTSICKVYMWFPDGQEYQGSGAVIDSFHVLTAGHCIYSYADGGWATKVEVIPEMSGGSQPFGVAWMTQERTYSTWVNASKSHPGQTGPGDMDIGLVTLDRTIGYRTGWMAFGYDGSSSYNLNTAGYPAAPPYSGQTMYWDYAVGSVSGSNIYFADGAVGGQSGSPLWSYYSSTGQRIIRGVLVGANGISTRITQQIFNDFEGALSSDTQPTAMAPVTATASAPVLGHAAAPAVVLPPSFVDKFLGKLAGGGSSQDRAARTDAVFTPGAAQLPAAARPAASTAAPPLVAATPLHPTGVASPLLDDLLSDALTPGKARL
jgi:V8-like Glu-specific endopeptidase